MTKEEQIIYGVVKQLDNAALSMEQKIQLLKEYAKDRIRLFTEWTDLDEIDGILGGWPEQPWWESEALYIKFLEDTKDWE